MSRPRLLLADDHILVVEGLRKLLEPEFELLDPVHDGRALVSAATQLKPDVVLVDISMPLLNGIEAARQIKKAWPPARFIFVTMHADPAYAMEALRVGAHGYVLKRVAASELVRAIREVLAGRRYFMPFRDPFVPVRQSDPIDGSQNLTARQREVLQLVAEGFSAKEIAATLHVSIKTVEFHKSAIMGRLGLRTIAALTAYAIRHGIVSP